MSTPGARPLSDADTREAAPAGRPPEPLFAPGDRLPNLEMWALERRLGAGGFGEVWLARHERKGVAAVKFCTAPAARHQLVTHEKTVVARVMRHCGNHPNVVPLLECNLSGDIPWLMYEYVEGGTLADALDGWRALTPPRRVGRAVRVLHALAGALATFHRLDPPLVHRDLKPHNVLMAGKTPRITDFGSGGAAVEAYPPAAPDTRSDPLGTLPAVIRTAGSSRYAPFEQCLGSPPSPRDDVFALGVIAYQLIAADTGAVPGADVGRELRARRIPAELVALIAASVELDPRRRPADAAEWDAVLTGLLHKHTAGAAARVGDPPPDDSTDPHLALGESQATGAAARTLALPTRGRWYARPAGPADAPWTFVTATPADVRAAPHEVYRFSIHSSAAPDEVAALSALGGLASLRYLNLSYCAGVTDAALELLRAFPGLLQLSLRGCPNVTDAGVCRLHALTGLHALELTDCEHVSAAAVAAVRAALPGCKVLG